MICPAMIANTNYIAVAEWYNSARSKNNLLRAELYIQQTFGATCFVSNLTCDLQDDFKQFAKLINIT
ncbi:hypothetical protein BgiBS90_007126, partial [Biomphalaria glabrata]